MKSATKAKFKESSNTPIQTAKLRLIGKANVSMDQTELMGHSAEHHAVRVRGALKTDRLSDQHTKQEKPGQETKAAARSRVPVLAEKVFDNLSTTLAGHAAQLSTEEQTKEQEIRKALVESLKHFDEDRTALAENLVEYKHVFKSQRQWTRVVTEIGAAIRVSARTVFRLIEDFERSQDGGESDIMIDLSPIQGAPLDKEDRPFVRARLAIRSFLDEVPTNRKPQALSALVAEEAYQIWGARNPFTLEVSPRPSRFTIDGRKRIVSSRKDGGEEK